MTDERLRTIVRLAGGPTLRLGPYLVKLADEQVATDKARPDVRTIRPAVAGSPLPAPCCVGGGEGADEVYLDLDHHALRDTLWAGYLLRGVSTLSFTPRVRGDLRDLVRNQAWQNCLALLELWFAEHLLIKARPAAGPHLADLRAHEVGLMSEADARVWVRADDELEEAFQRRLMLAWRTATNDAAREENLRILALVDGLYAHLYPALACQRPLPHQLSEMPRPEREAKYSSGRWPSVLSESQPGWALGHHFLSSMGSAWLNLVPAPAMPEPEQA